MEYLAIFGIAALMLFPLIYLFATQTSTMEADIAYARVESAASRIIASAEEIYFQGPPARKTLKVTFPKSITSVLIDEHSLIITLQTIDGEFEIIKDTTARLQGSISTFEGDKFLVFESIGGFVVISES